MTATVQDRLTVGIPSAVEDRLPDRWLVFGPTFVLAVRAPNIDVARALVLIRLGYAHRTELVENLTARNASEQEIQTICYRRRMVPLQERTPSHVHVNAVVAEIAERERRNDRSPVDGRTKHEARAPRNRKRKVKS